MEKDSVVSHLKEIYGLAKKHSILSFNVVFRKTLTFDEKEWNEDDQAPGFIGRFAPSNFKGPENFAKDLESLLGVPAADLSLLLTPVYVGFPFQSLSQLTGFAGAKTELALAPKKGEVTLFHFWSPSISASIQPMVAQQTMLQSHPDWTPVVRLVGVCKDPAADVTIKSIVDQNALAKHNQYFVTGKLSGEAESGFLAQPVPFCVLTDKEGVVRAAGHPMEFSWEKLVADVIAGKSAAGALEEAAGPALKDKGYGYATFKKELKQLVSDEEASFDSVADLLVSASFTERGTEQGTREGHEAILELSFTSSKKSQLAAIRIKSAVQARFDSKLIVKISEEVTKIRALSYGEKCGKCGKPLGAGCSQYRCVHCKPELYFCVDCIHHKEIKTVGDLVHPHPLFYLQEKSKAQLEEIVLGELKVHEPTKDSERKHEEYACDVCGKVPKGIHWKCANCAAVDLCNGCFEAGRNEKDARHEEVLEECKELKHDPMTHIYIREDFAGMYDPPSDQ